MNKRTATWLAWICWALTTGSIAGQLFIQQLGAPTTLVNGALGTLVVLAFAMISLLIVSRRPENRIGWVLSIGTLLWAAGDFGLDYCVYGLLTAPGSLPAALWVGLLAGCFRGAGFVLVLFVVLLLFPDGHLPSPRWRSVAWLVAASIALQVVAALFSPDLSDLDLRLSSFGNPLGTMLPEAISSFISALPVFSSVAAIVACVAAIVVRFQRSRGDERQQLKWLTYSSFLSTIILVVVMAGALLNLDYVSTFGGLLFDLLLLPIPLAVGIAILKYRLYDIDVIVNRTLVYGSLTAMLALVYWGGVALLQAVLRPIEGAGNDLAIVATTLLIAALFLPLRTRTQAFIDQRFYRRKYDAARTLAAFGQVARDETDLEALTGRLVGVVQETMQPEHVSLWVSEPARSGWTAFRAGEGKQ